MLLVVLAAGPAHADKRIQGLIPGYQREATACSRQSAGMQKVATGVATLARAAEDREKVELEKAAEVLAKGGAAVAEYCSEVGALVSYLKEHADDAYKTVEREIDGRASKTSRLRREAKRQIEELAPLTRKMIPRIMKLPTAAPEPEKRTPAKFPSGRSVELPVLSGAWRTSGTSLSDVVEYEDKQTTATLTTRSLPGACDEHRPPNADDMEIDVKDFAWAVRLLRKEDSGAHLTMMACTPRRDRSVLAVVDVTPPTSALADKLLEVVLRMAAGYEK